jgi:hypothetical protein
LSNNGLITRTATRAFLGTVHLNKHLRLIEKLYFWVYRIPQNGNFSEADNDKGA